MEGPWTMTHFGNLSVGTQGFGGMALADVYGPTDEATALRTLHHALDRGIRLIDTANVYGAGSNEALVGKVLATRRDEVTLATKFGILPNPDANGHRARGDAAYVRESVTASLQRLGVDHIDLYYYHRVDSRVPIEETVGAIAELVREGVVGHIGLSEVTASELQRAHAVHPITAVQSEWSVWSRDVEDAVIPTAARLGVGFVAYSPLGRGFLAAPVEVLDADDLRRKFPRFSDERLAANAPIGHAVRELAASQGITPAQLALAWLYEQGRRQGVGLVPIPSTRRPERIDENLSATLITLPQDVLDALEPLAGGVFGDRARFVEDISQGRERVGA